MSAAVRKRVVAGLALATEKKRREQKDKAGAVACKAVLSWLCGCGYMCVCVCVHKKEKVGGRREGGENAMEEGKGARKGHTSKQSPHTRRGSQRGGKQEKENGEERGSWGCSPQRQLRENSVAVSTVAAHLVAPSCPACANGS